jgi:hypothetical protein
VWLPAGEAARRKPGALPWDVAPPPERARGAGPPWASVDGAAAQAQSGIARSPGELGEEMRIERRPGA